MALFQRKNKIDRKFVDFTFAKYYDSEIYNNSKEKDGIEWTL